MQQCERDLDGINGISNQLNCAVKSRTLKWDVPTTTTSTIGFVLPPVFL